MDSASLTALALFGLAVGLVLAEVLFGSDGSLFLLAGVAAIGGFVFVPQSNWLPQPLAWWGYPAIALGGTLGATVLGVYIFPRTALGQNLLDDPDAEDVGPIAPDEPERLQYLGRRGKALTVMNPGGLILLDGERRHAESEGLVIERGETVEVMGLRANRFVVRPTNH